MMEQVENRAPGIPQAPGSACAAAGFEAGALRLFGASGSSRLRCWLSWVRCSALPAGAACPVPSRGSWMPERCALRGPMGRAEPPCDDRYQYDPGGARVPSG